MNRDALRVCLPGAKSATWCNCLCRFELCSGKSHLEVRLPGGRTVSVARLMRLLHIVGIVLAVIGISGAVSLFNAKTMADLASAQQDRKTSSRVSLVYWP